MKHSYQLSYGTQNFKILCHYSKHDTYALYMFAWSKFSFYTAFNFVTNGQNNDCHYVGDILRLKITNWWQRWMSYLGDHKCKVVCDVATDVTRWLVRQFTGCYQSVIHERITPYGKWFSCGGCKIVKVYARRTMKYDIVLLVTKKNILQHMDIVKLLSLWR
jgi:hypothetical protein